MHWSCGASRYGVYTGPKPITIAMYSTCGDLARRLAEDPAGPRAPALRAPERQQRLKEVGAAFREHVHDALPWLIPTRRGRIAADERPRIGLASPARASRMS